MQIQVVDANNIIQNVIWQAPGTPTDRSGTYSGASQIVLDAIDPASGVVRGGYLFQNRSVSSTIVQINDIGGAADNVSPTCIDVPPGGTFPPPGYPVTQGEVTVIGPAGESFAAREW